MLYGQDLYSKYAIYSQGIDLQNKLSDIDVLYHIYRVTNVLSKKKYTWVLYKRTDEDSPFEEVNTDITKTGIIEINFNDYDLQFINNNYNLVIYNNGKEISSVYFWYYYNIYLQSPREYPWYTGYIIDRNDGSSDAVIMNNPHKFPKLRITNVDQTKENINVSVTNIKEL